MEDITNTPSNIVTVEDARSYLHGLLDAAPFGVTTVPLPCPEGYRIFDVLAAAETTLASAGKQIEGLTQSKDYWFNDHQRVVRKMNEILDTMRTYIEDNDLQQDEITEYLISQGMQGFSREVDATVTLTVTVTVRAEDVPTSIGDDDLEQEITDAVEQNINLERWMSCYMDGAEVRFSAHIDEVSTDRVDLD